MTDETRKKLAALFAEMRRLHDEAWARLRQPQLTGEAITSSPAVVSVFDGISESAAQALCEAIEQEIAPLAAQRDDLLSALKELTEHSRPIASLPEHEGTAFYDAVSDALYAIASAEGRS